MTNPRHFTPKDVFDKAREVANDHPDIVRGGLWCGLLRDRLPGGWLVRYRLRC